MSPSYLPVKETPSQARAPLRDAGAHWLFPTVFLSTLSFCLGAVVASGQLEWQAQWVLSTSSDAPAPTGVDPFYFSPQHHTLQKHGGGT